MICVGLAYIYHVDYSYCIFMNGYEEHESSEYNESQDWDEVGGLRDTDVREERYVEEQDDHDERSARHAVRDHY